MYVNPHRVSTCLRGSGNYQSASSVNRTCAAASVFTLVSIFEWVLAQVQGDTCLQSEEQLTMSWIKLSGHHSAHRTSSALSLNNAD